MAGEQEALEGYNEDLGPETCRALERIAMDMWAPYIATTREKVPNAEEKIVFDKFHIAKVRNAVGMRTRRTRKGA